METNKGGGRGSNSDVHGLPYKLIVLNFEAVGLTLTNEERTAHESGHNAAANHWHTKSGTGKYEYFHKGLSSNEKGKVYPTYENTKSILDDELNRSTIF